MKDLCAGPCLSWKDRSALKMSTYSMGSIGSTFYNGRFTWNVSDVARKHWEALGNPSTSLTSPPWYIHCSWWIQALYPPIPQWQWHWTWNTRLHIFLQAVMKSEYDQIVLWSLKCRTSFSLLDLELRGFPIVKTLHSNPNSSAFQQPPPQSAMNIASCCPDFAPLYILDDKRYVDDDEMYIKCIMDVHSQLYVSQNQCLYSLGEQGKYHLYLYPPSITPTYSVGCVPYIHNYMHVAVMMTLVCSWQPQVGLWCWVKDIPYIGWLFQTYTDLGVLAIHSLYKGGFVSRNGMISLRGQWQCQGSLLSSTIASIKSLS